MSMMRARVRGHRWVDHPVAAVMKARVPGQWVDCPAAVVMEAREQGRCWIDHPAVAVMEARYYYSRFVNILRAPAADWEDARSEGETEEMESSQPDDSQRLPLPQQDQPRRGRPEERQATLSSSLRLQNPPRHRSETPKRPRSSKESSPREVTGRGKYTK
ncbi:hypothetical protein ACOMHN_014830 [Nucella lapillus]